MSEGKLLCDLNCCSDGEDRQYPDCTIVYGCPNVCPRDPAVAEIMRKANAHGNLVEALKDVRRLESQAHELWDQAFTNCVKCNPSVEQRKGYIRSTYQATTLHASAMEKMTAALKEVGEEIK